MKIDIKLPGIENCPVNTIVYIEGKGNYSIVHLKNLKQVVMAKTLKKFEAQLRMNQFVRIHKSYLVNKENIPTFDSKGATEVPTALGTTLPISRRKLDFVRRTFA
ncbi:LytR/AlgR family response regulator transcription factor [Aquirufa sp.]|jgi:DNA-binding LytR/AlgR family response regulator|uniref:LytR/AlgR family response regulator transcription factor n=1 Tax=Aquirufa sp. TaxID=2676249 RepID=UPI0037C01B99